MIRKLSSVFSLIVGLLVIAPALNVALAAESGVSLTSATLDCENSIGQTGNAPGNEWTTNLGDPLTQLGVSSQGVFLNQLINGQPNTLGEIAIPLKIGDNDLSLYANTYQHYYPCGYYGAILYFNGEVMHPQIAVYNAFGSADDFLVQTEGTLIMGSANGGEFFVSAPGTSTFTTANGKKVAITKYIVNSTDEDLISAYTIGADGMPERVGKITIVVSFSTQNIKDSIDQMYQDGTITGLGTSLYDKLSKVQADVDVYNYRQARRDIQGLLHQITAQLGKHIDTTVGNALIDQIIAFRNSLP
jgi:hypothetical protein